MDLEKLHREESGRVLATLIRLLGDFDLAEEMLQEAYAVALEKWPSEGEPSNPRTWLISTARYKAIDRIRRDQRFERKREEIAKSAPVSAPPAADFEAASTDDMFPDDQLRLIFTCCHPALGRITSRAHAAHHLRHHHRGNLQSVFSADADDGSAARPRETQNPRRQRTLPGTAGR
jgi:predicted RNA polymerase sigma factor